MRKETKGLKAWTKPEIRRLGEIKDVAGSPAGAVQNASKS
jgi:hypothetical protein